MKDLIRADRPERIHRIFKGAVDDVSKSKRTVTSIITTDAVDHYREVIVARGVDLSAYRENPVVLWMHDMRTVIGRNVGLSRKTKNDSAVWVAKTLFAKTEKADEIFQLYVDAFLNGWSIGAMPDWSCYSAPTPEEVKAEPRWKVARALVRKCKLTEYSAVSVPANPECLGNELEKRASAELVRMIRESESWPDLIVDEGPAPEAKAADPGEPPHEPGLPPLPPALPPLIGRTLARAIEDTRAMVARMTGPDAAKAAAAEALDRLKGRV